MPDSIRTLFFPRTFREIPHRRIILNLLRSAHILCFSILFGGLFFHQNKVLLTWWLAGVVITGLGMFLVDLYGSLIALFEVRGISLLIKIPVLACVPLVEENIQIAVFIAVIIFSSFISHSTRRIRHKNLMSQAFQDKFGLSDEKGSRRIST